MDVMRTRTGALDSRLSRRSLLRFTVAAAGVAAFGSLLAACGDDADDDGESDTSSAASTPTAATGGASGSTATGGAGGGTTHTVEMNAENKFDPDAITIKVGDTITWVTVGAMPHSATSDPAKAVDKSHAVVPEGAEVWDSGILTEGQEFSHTFTVAGDYTYFCIPHESLGMIGTVTVEE